MSDPSSKNKMKTVLTYAFTSGGNTLRTKIFECDKDAYDWFTAQSSIYVIISINHLLDWEEGGNW